MATLTNIPTMLDILGIEVNGKVSPVINSLWQKNQLIPDLYWEEGNEPSGHKTVVLVTEPTVSSRQINGGVTPGLATTDTITDSVALLEAYSAVDIKALALSANPTAYRSMQDDAYVSAFAKKVTNLWFLGNGITTPSDFTGLAPRYNDLDGATGNNIIDCGASGSDNSSMYLIGHGPEGVAAIYGRGGSPALKKEDKGEQLWQSSVTFGAATSAFRAAITWFEWTVGLSLRNWQYVVRMANIDVSEAQGLSGAQEVTDYGTFLLTMMIKAYYKIPNPDSVRLAYYCNRSIAYALHIMAMAKASAQLTIEQVDGKPVTMFMKIPVRTVDQLGVAETLVTNSTVTI